MRAFTKIVLSTCAVCTVAQGRHSARAQPDQPTEPTSTNTGQVHTDDNDMYSNAWSDPLLSSGIGVSVLLGGGVTGFTDKEARDRTSSVGGLWDLRVTIGSHIPLGLDVSYVGTATSIDNSALLPGQSATLIGTAFEGAVRYNILPHYTWNPYIFVGIGWQHYDVTDTHATLALNGMNDSDDLLEFPMGAGLSYRMGGFVADIRGVFRATTYDNLILKDPALYPASKDYAPMHSWEASAAVGYEF